MRVVSIVVVSCGRAHIFHFFFAVHVVVPTEQHRFRPETIAPTGNGRFGGVGRGRAALPPVKNHDNREFAVEMDYHTRFDDDDEQSENAPTVEHNYIPEGLNIDGALLLEQDQQARGDQQERTGACV